MSNLTTAYTTLCLGLACRERWEIVVEKEPLVITLQSAINEFLIKFGTQGGCGQCLSLTTCEDCTSVGSWQWTYLAPDRTDVSGETTIKTGALIKYTTAHSVALHIIVIAVNHAVLLFQLFLAEVGVSGCIGLLESIADGCESIFASVFVAIALFGNLVALVVAFLTDLLAQLVVVHLMAVFTLHICAQLLLEFLLHLAHRLDGVMSGFQRSKQVLLAHFFHLAFNHHDVFLCGTHHQVHVSLFQLLEGRIDDKLTIDSCHADFRDRALERYI